MTDGSGEHDDGRQDKRDSLFLSATVSVAGGTPVAARVRNLSAGGMLIDIAVPVTAGDPIEGNLRGIGAISGMIAWVGTGQAGIAFDDDVDPRLARTPTGAKTTTPAYFHSVPTKRPGLRAPR